EGPLRRGLRHPAEPAWHLPAPADTGRGAVRSRDLRRAAELAAGGAMRRGARGFACCVALAAAMGALALGLTRPTPPSFDAVRAALQPPEARLLDRHGELLATRRIDPTRRRLPWVPLSEVSPALRAAVVAAEDRRFAEHGGVDARALAAAVAQGL